VTLRGRVNCRSTSAAKKTKIRLFLNLRNNAVFWKFYLHRSLFTITIISQRSKNHRFVTFIERENLTRKYWSGGHRVSSSPLLRGCQSKAETMYTTCTSYNIHKHKPAANNRLRKTPLLQKFVNAYNLCTKLTLAISKYAMNIVFSNR